MNKTSFYHDGPLFGLDIGYTRLRVMQLDSTHSHTPRVVGYGLSKPYTVDTMRNGIIINQQLLGHRLDELFDKGLTGGISTRRVACTLPMAYTFSRLMRLPSMPRDEVAEAVGLEAEQYIPVPKENLYLDYEILSSGADSINLLMVAAPKNVVDSYMKFLDVVGLEPVALEPTLNAISRIFGLGQNKQDTASILMDFGPMTIDLAVYDQTIAVNSTVSGGTLALAASISKQLKARETAHSKKGRQMSAAVKGQQIMAAIEPVLDNLSHEINKLIRYYESRAAHNPKISQIITTGEGANVPGIEAYLKDSLGLPVKPLEPWKKLDFGHLDTPSDSAKPQFAASIGMALANPKEALG